MKKNIFITIIVALLFSIASCEQEEVFDFNSELKSTNTNEKFKDYDKRMSKAGKALSKALNDVEVRKLIKAYALERWDGDTEFLFGNIKDQMTNNNVTFLDLVSESIEYDNEKEFKKELKSYFSKNEDETIDNLSSKDVKVKYINKILTDFPALQIAVRGNVDKWDVENVHPLVVYIPLNFEESWSEIEAFDKNGKKVMLNLDGDIADPFIVLMKCERTDIEGNLMEAYKNKVNTKSALLNTLPPYCLPITAPTNVTAVVHPSGVFVSWNYTSGSHPDEFVRIVIKRDGGGSNGVLVGEVSADKPVGIYDTNNLVTGQPYRYIAYAYALSSQSGGCDNTTFDYSDWLTIPPNNREMQSFTASRDGNNTSFTWVRPVDEGYLGVRLRRNISGQGWQNFTTLNGNDINSYSTTDYVSEYGVNITWEVTTFDAFGSSDAKYDVVKSSERRTGEALFIRAIKIEDVKSIESKAFGEPEIETTVSHYDPNDPQGDGKPLYYVQNQTVMDPQLSYYVAPGEYDSRTGNYPPNGYYEARLNQQICLWDLSLHKGVMNIQIAEHDAQWIALAGKAIIGACKAIKTGLTPEQLLLQAGGAAAIEAVSFYTDEFNMHNADKQIGAEAYPYWSYPDYTLDLGYGCNVRISRTSYDGSETWLSAWNK